MSKRIPVIGQTKASSSLVFRLQNLTWNNKKKKHVGKKSRLNTHDNVLECSSILQPLTNNSRSTRTLISLYIVILSGLHFHRLYFVPLNLSTFLVFSTLFGSSLVSDLLTALAAVPRFIWCPQPAPCIQKSSWCMISSHPSPASCVFVPIYLMSFLALQVLLSSDRFYSLNLIIPFALFWILSNSFILFARKHDQNGTQFSKERYGQV